MTQPPNLAGRPLMPAPGAPTPELRVARVRGHARRLFWSALVLIVVAGAVGYFFDNLPTPFEEWMLLAGAGLVVFVLVVIPFLVWLTHTYTITTRRVIERRGVFFAHRSEVSHARGYAIRERRGPVQRLWGCGTLILANGIDAPLQMKNIAAVSLVHEVLADQVEVSQILAHRDSHSIPVVPDASDTDPTQAVPRTSI